MSSVKAFFAIVSTFVATVGGCLHRPVWSPEPVDLAPPRITRTTQQPDVMGGGVLFVIDNSVSMADKQKLLASAIDRTRNIWSICIGPDGEEEPPTGGVCPDDFTSRGRSILGQAHVITSSLEGGGEVCIERTDGGVPVDRSGEEDPIEQILRVGEAGCGFEAPLEAMYRFLIDPEPPATVTVTGEGSAKTTAPDGVAEDLLATRAEFLKAYPSVLIIILTDEDDCSVRDSGDAWEMGDETVPRGTSACARDPGSACCRPCDLSEEEPPEGCAPLSEDLACLEGMTLDSREAPLNTRCWAQKRRFGKDYLFPVERYTEALTSPTITNRRGQRVENPLFKYGSTPDMVQVLLLSGVPWQLITKPESHGPGQSLEFLTPSELEASRVWDKLLGDPAQNVPPSDPHLLESVEPRAGLPLPGVAWDPIHGHDVVWPRKDSLQHSCVFELPEPETCTESRGCTCDPRLETESPLCRQPDGSYGEPQRFAGAFPPTRLLQFARSLGERAEVGSICPKQLKNPRELGYGYNDFIHQALLDRNRAFHQACFTPSLPIREDGTPKCKLLEFYRDQEIDCESLGRIPVDDEYRRPMQLKDTDRGTLCEIPRMPGDPSNPTSDYYRCAHELHPTLESKGYCYIDTPRDLGSPDLVVPCIDSHKRFFRSIPAALGRPGTEVGLICDYRKE
jgi:hypothetical protein